ncbi:MULTISPECIES: nucleotide sugar dehydrogenase [Streptomyces]|uniref:Nucleotide sugar dehydrogenase n=1 Tax=Streptomyces lycii TaxID=2654337 RepID=A0ABQ7FGG3_9ACTN|nr:MULTISPECIES: nucleotide sugar dehydrogenase [Streptomyces]KAF4407687.1 nucleotide sugar dehydrogenase [Streptomyces lycii]PGH47540.1 UDP-N-acetyl-D-glucosamine dehydrogenase [Streptomyces sp. Ru87]
MEHSQAVVGLGYVGLSVAEAASAVGGDVVGIDVEPGKVASLNEGRSPVDVLADDDLALMLDRGFRATTDAAVLASCDTVVICVPTPLDADRRPDLSLVRTAAETVARHLRPGTLVVVESTIWPGATEDVVLPLLEHGSGLTAGADFHLAYSPERVDCGNPEFDIRNTPKVVAGHTQACADRAAAFYGKFIGEIVPVAGIREAELCKLLENTYRSVNIALVNEMAVFCDELGIDLWESIRAAATKPFGFERFLPGPGVGGHCIPVDPLYLTHAVRALGRPFRLVELAVEVNEAMPEHVFSRVQRQLNGEGKCLQGADVLVVGVTYKPDVADLRESPATPLVRSLRRAGARVTFADPLVEEWSVDGVPVHRAEDLASTAAVSDIAVLLQPHQALDLRAVTDAGCSVLDTRGVLPRSRLVERL